MKKFFVLLVSVVLCFGLSGCSMLNSEESTDENSDTALSSDHPKIEELDWEVKEGVYEGERQLLFSYRNNSKYDIVRFNITFEQRDNLTEEDLTVFDEIKSEYNLTDEEVKEIHLKAPGGAYQTVYTNSGDFLESAPCHLFMNAVPETDYYGFMEPDTATIDYLENDSIHTVYFDFKNKEYTKGPIKEASTWPSGSLSDLLPKVELKVIDIDSDDENSISFNGYGADEQVYNEFVNGFKEKGFTVNMDENRTSYGVITYEGSDLEGYNILIEYDDRVKTIGLFLEKPE